MSFPHPLPLELLKAPAGAPPNLAFRPVRRDDLFPLHRALYPHLALSALRARLEISVKEQASGQRIHLIAEFTRGGYHDRQATLVGSGELINYIGRKVEIANLAVAPAHRGRGIGSALITVFCHLARAGGYRSVEISVLVENERALALYQRLGFKQSRLVTIPGRGEAAILKKELSS
ncbi:MAG: GNAT family N-acetyltransferase [Candidatus Promineifilaceae bacterium]|nr:GNAT family N-acetyltransferase [Candidatus Promineifilaceae bacterium]